MPTIRAVDFSKTRRADDNHRHNPEGNKVRDAIFTYVTRRHAAGHRHVTYNEMVRHTGYPESSVRYHFRKLVACSAIKIDTPEEGSDEQATRK